MSNNYFRFKQFTIHQERCAMKVTTDACIFGAWAYPASDGGRMLDVGTGTGLLALMMAQRFPGFNIDGIELDPTAALQAGENAGASPWGDKVRITEGDINEFKPEDRYDFLISNPPFFRNSLAGPDAARNRARHTHSLDDVALLAAANRLLKPGGQMALLLPAPEFELCEAFFNDNGWYANRKLLIRTDEDAQVNRVVGVFLENRHFTSTIESLTVYENDRNYTPEFLRLLSPFYLKL